MRNPKSSATAKLCDGRYAFTGNPDHSVGQPEGDEHYHYTECHGRQPDEDSHHRFGAEALAQP